ncbi:hypothetical protein BgiMline_009365 [Biomphalaria glabrata]|nr:CAunnamed protein product [Biomphalaria glabrata]
MKFYKEHYRNLNLDGFFGLRIMQGQLQMLVTEYKANPHGNFSSDIIEHIETLVQSSSNVSALGLKYIENDDPVYFHKFRPIILSPWRIKKPHRKLEPHLRWEIPQYKAKLKVKLTEELSDKCIVQLLQPDCNITEDCADIMTTRALTGYGITHQLLWTAIGETTVNCTVNMNKIMETHGFGNVSAMQLEWCTNNFYEMVAIVQVLMHRKIHESQQDLFFEQQFVCPSLGFYEFLKMEYLKQMLTWQFPMGCFGDRNTETDINSLLFNYQEGQTLFLHNKVNAANGPVTLKDGSKTLESEKSEQVHFVKEKDLAVSENSTNIVTLKSNATFVSIRRKQRNIKQSSFVGKLKQSSKTQRRLLNEKLMEDGCLSHKTAVAVGALCSYIRYMIEPGNIQWTGQHELFLMDMRSLLQADGDGQLKLSVDRPEEEDEHKELEDLGAANNDHYPAEEEEEEEEGEDEEEYNQDAQDYVSEQPKAHLENPVIQFDQRDNDNIMVNEDNEKELIEYSNVHDDTGAEKQMLPLEPAENNMVDTREQQEDRNYYDDEGETEKGIIKRNRQITPRPRPPIRTRKKHGSSSDKSSENVLSDQPNYMVIVLVSVSPFFVLLLFLLKFIRKRRVHKRHTYF